MAAVVSSRTAGDDEVEALALSPAASGPASRRPLGDVLRGLGDSVAWGDRHRVLVRQPPFSRCTRSEIRRLLAWGEVLDVRAGEVLTREGSVACWLFVVLEGELVESTGGLDIGRVGAGGHVGAEAVLGFAPQPTTVRTGGRTIVFCLGRRYVMSIAHLPGVLPALIPGTAGETYAATRRRLMADGDAAWRVEAARWPAGPPAGRSEALLARSAGASAVGRSEFQRLAAEACRPAGTAPALQASATRPPWRWRRPVVAALAAIVALVMAVVGILYHPPIALVLPGETFDVAEDIAIEGVDTMPLNGRYLATPVRYVRPNLLGALVAKVRGETSTPVRRLEPDERVAAQRRGGEAFAESQLRAVRAAASAAGLDPDHLPFTVSFDERRLQGGSAGLAYALALTDLLDSADLAGGRTMVATGVLSADGEVLPVLFPAVKARAVRARGAALFLVPALQADAVRSADTAIEGVTSVADALDRLRIAAR